MNTAAYRDGFEVGKRRGGDADAVRQAIADCREMGWNYLGAYFSGKLAALEKMQDIGEEETITATDK